MATVIISSLALIVSIGSLTWQVVAWFHSGPRLNVELCKTTGRAGGKESSSLAVVVTNVGRSAVTIHEIVVYMWTSRKIDRSAFRGYLFMNEQLAEGRDATLPIRLEPSDETIAWYNAESVRKVEGDLRQMITYEGMTPSANDYTYIAFVRSGLRKVYTRQLSNNYRDRPVSRS